MGHRTAGALKLATPHHCPGPEEDTRPRPDPCSSRYRPLFSGQEENIKAGAFKGFWKIGRVYFTHISISFTAKSSALTLQIYSSKPEVSYLKRAHRCLWSWLSLM